jgi:hypothetical protein
VHLLCNNHFPIEREILLLQQVHNMCGPHLHVRGEVHLLFTLVVQQSFPYRKENVIVTTGTQHVHSSPSHEGGAHM